MTLLDAIHCETPETLAGGRYVVQSILGRGGSSVVYRCLDRHLGVECAVKILNPLRGCPATQRARLVREAAISSRLSHPNLVPVLASGDEHGWVYAVSELVDGESLRDRIRTRGAIRPIQAVEWMIQVTEGLSAAHDRSIVHRDVRPANILIDRWGTPRLIDFGIALDPGQARLTQQGHGIGSLGWSPPEQLRDARSVGPEADVYGAAATLYWMITGLSPVDLCYVDRYSPRWGAVPLPLVPVLAKAMSVKPEDRYRDARTLRSALRGALRSLRGERSPWSTIGR